MENTIIDQIKEQVDLVKLIGETPGVNLRRSGKNYMGFCPFHVNTHSPALSVFPDTRTWYCFSCNEGGSVIDWVLKKNPGWDIKEAIKDLARRAGLPLPEYDHQDVKARLTMHAHENALQVASKLFQKWLYEDTEALEYVHSRGWTDKVIQSEQVGFSGRATAAQVKEMIDAFGLNGIFANSPDAVMVLGYKGDIPAWCNKHNIDPKSVGQDKISGLISVPGLIYSHRINGRIQYMARRQLPGHDFFVDQGEKIPWKSFNPCSALAGDRKAYFNQYHLRNERLVIVEGQGDAITLAHWGIPAMALAGSEWKNQTELIKSLQDKYEVIYFATDSDEAGQQVITGKKGAFPLAEMFGPMLWVVNWPQEKWTVAGGSEKQVKDVNDLRNYYLSKDFNDQRQANAINKILDDANPIVQLAVQHAGSKKGAERQKALDVVVPMLKRMPEMTLKDMRTILAKALFPDIPNPIREFSNLLKTKGEETEDSKPAEIVETMGGWYPTNADGNEGYLLEETYDKATDKAIFAYAHIFLDGSQPREISTAHYMDINGKRYVPKLDDNVRFGTVLLPSELGPEQSTREILAAVEIFLRRYFLLDNPFHYKFGALYGMFTWVYDAFDQLPYLRARGGPGSGKSEFMLRLGLVCYRMMITAGVSSLAGFKGLAHVYKGTLMIDEVDNLLKEDKGEMRALLNVRAMKKQARVVTMMEVLKADGTHGFAPATTFVYGPTLMTMYGAFKDPGTESRCMTFDMPDKESIELDKAGIEPGYTPPEMEIEGQVIRNILLRW
jgi:5S rRNA maturation endonuclease (ribonuclease M5)